MDFVLYHSFWLASVCGFPSRSFPAVLWLLQSSSLCWLLLDSPSPRHMVVRALFLFPVFRAREVGKRKSHTHREGKRLSPSSSLCSVPHDFVFHSPAGDICFDALLLFRLFIYFFVFLKINLPSSSWFHVLSWLVLRVTLSCCASSHGARSRSLCLCVCPFSFFFCLALYLFCSLVTYADSFYFLVRDTSVTSLVLVLLAELPPPHLITPPSHHHTTTTPHSVLVDVISRGCAFLLIRSSLSLELCALAWPSYPRHCEPTCVSPVFSVFFSALSGRVKAACVSVSVCLYVCV